MERLPFIEPERCGKCGRLAILYDRKNQICFQCYHDLSPINSKVNKKQESEVRTPADNHVLDVKA